MTRYDANCPNSIVQSIEWIRQFRESSPAKDSIWLNFAYSARTLSIEISRRRHSPSEETIATLARALDGICTVYPALTPEDVQATVVALSNEKRRRILRNILVGAGLTVTITQNLIMIHLTPAAQLALQEHHFAARVAFDKAITRMNVLHLLDIISDGTIETVAGKAVTKDATQALDLLIQKVGSLMALPPSLAALVARDEG